MVRPLRCFLWAMLAFTALSAAERLPAQSSRSIQDATASAVTQKTTPGDSAIASPPFDVHAAVEAYLAKMPRSQRARSNAYFEGGYWMQLWDFLSTVLVMWLLLRFRWSMRMRELA